MSEVTRNLIATGVVLVVTLAAYLTIVWAGKRFVERQQNKPGEAHERAQTLWSLIRRVILITLILISFLLVLTVWEVNLTPFLAVGTVIGAAVGFGAQDLVRDFLAGFFILAEDQYHIGDTITIAGVAGTVEDIQLRVTVLRDLNGNAHYVPNGQITVTSNFTSVFAQPVLDINVGYGEDIDTAMRVIIDEANKLYASEEWRDTFRGEPEMLGVNELADSSVVIRLRLTTDADERWTVRREALRRIKNRLDAEGIEIPFPQIRVHDGK